MPTRRGWLVLASGSVLLVLGWATAAGPVEQLGFGLVAFVGIAIGVARLGRHDLEVTRIVSPPRIGAGQLVTVTIRLVNRGRGAAPLMLLEDRIPAELSGRARFAFQGLEAGGTREDSFGLRAMKRGHYDVGPMEVSFLDPFGLAGVVGRAAELTSFLVHPRIEPLALPRDSGQHRSLAVSALRQPTGARGEDFYTLREYAEGDDLRRIHWPSTAKRQKYMIRQEETPWHTRATILLDDRAEPHEGVGEASTFERTVEAAASLAELYHRSGYTYRLVGAHYDGLATGRGSEHFHRALDMLATIDPVGTASPDHALLARLAQIETGSTAEGTLILVAGTIGSDAAIGLTRCRRRFKQVVAISFPGHRFSGATTKVRWEGERTVVEVVRLLARSGVRAIVLGPGDSLATGWASLSRSRPGGGESAWDRKPELV